VNIVLHFGRPTQERAKQVKPFFDFRERRAGGKPENYAAVASWR
jgi:hypothetical protein